MSNFTGVTFAKQRVTPSDDAIIRRAILSDGKLTGCEISYSGSTLTMAPGQLLVCGRQIRHPSVQNWAVVDATSGFARLVLTVDLTRAATKETFEQVETSVEYASAEDGFVELEQSDINSSGIRYQVALCVVSLGVGGITGIVSQLEKCEAGGSGGLNFNVVGGLTQPANLKENSIWVITDVPITTWIFSPTEPEPPADGKDGTVWFLMGTSSEVAFNALKKNAIEVHPTSAKQYVGGAWVDREAKSYQNGELVNWWAGELFKYGNEFEAVTGGWVCTPAPYNKAGDGSSGAEMIPTKNENGGYTLYHGGSTKGAIWHAANKIDVTDVKEIKFVGSFSATNGNHVGLALYSKIDYCIQNRAAFLTGVLQYGTHTLNVADVTGEYYVGFHVYNTNTIVVDEVIME